MSLRKKKNKNQIFSLLFIGGSIFALIGGVILVQQTQIFSPKAAPGTKMANYNWSCLQNNGCLIKADSDSSKVSCYSGCRTAGTSSGTKLSQSALAAKEISYMRKYLTLYGSTNYGGWRNYFVNDPTKTDGQYYRTVCNTAAVNALIAKYDNSSNIELYKTLTDRLMSSIDDYDKYWGKSYASWEWMTAIPMYDCAVLASIMWDKLQPATAWDAYIGQPSRTVTQKKNLVREKIITHADKILTRFSSAQMKSNQQSIGDTVWNFQGEESAWNGAFLSLVAKLIPDAANAARYSAEALQLSRFSYSQCTDTKTCIYDQTNKGPNSQIQKTAVRYNPSNPSESQSITYTPEAYAYTNHGFHPQPSYGMAVIGNNARAALPYFVFGNKTRDSIPTEFKMQAYSSYDFVNLFEKVMSTWFYPELGVEGTFSRIPYNPYPSTQGITNYKDFSYMGAIGTTEVGVRGDFNGPSAFAMAFVTDTYDFNGYRSNTGVLSKYYGRQDAMTLDNTLFYPTQFVNGQWVRTPLAMAKTSTAPWDKYITQSTDTDQMTNFNFFVNSMKAFEHLVSFMFYTPNTYLQILRKP